MVTLALPLSKLLDCNTNFCRDTLQQRHHRLWNLARLQFSLCTVDASKQFLKCEMSTTFHWCNVRGYVRDQGHCTPKGEGHCLLIRNWILRLSGFLNLKWGLNITTFLRVLERVMSLWKQVPNEPFPCLRSILHDQRITPEALLPQASEGRLCHQS